MDKILILHPREKYKQAHAKLEMYIGRGKNLLNQEIYLETVSKILKRNLKSDNTLDARISKM